MAGPEKAIGQRNRQAAVIDPHIRLNISAGEEIYSRIRNLSRFFASLIQFGARPLPDQVAPVAGSRYFAADTPRDLLSAGRRSNFRVISGMPR